MPERPKILCVEDDPPTLELLAEFLNEEGFQPFVARNGSEGVAMFAKSPDAVLCDIDMPGMDGFGVLQALRQLAAPTRAAPFLFITGYGNRENHLRALRLGCDDFIMKPLDFELLVEMLRGRLAQAGRGAAAQQILTDRECEVMGWVAQGKSSHDIGALINISERTVNFHVNNVIRKLGVATRLQAALQCARLGLIGN